MTATRTSYVKLLPFVFLTGLLCAGGEIFNDFHYSTPAKQDQLNVLYYLFTAIRLGAPWIIIGVALKKIKPALIACAITIALLVINHYLYKIPLIRETPVLGQLQSLLFSLTFIPSLVFGRLCFKTRGLLYFLPLALLDYALVFLSNGSAYLDTSPFNAWYHLLRIGEYFKVYVNGGSFYMLIILSYTFHLVAPVITYILAGECFQAAVQNKKFKELFRIDLSNRYTKQGALSLFFSLRIAINLLVVALYTYPISSLSQSGRLFYKDISLFSIIITLLAGLACLAGVVLYYRKFLIEYFIGIRKKIYWLFWVINIPIVGMVVFSFVALLHHSTESTEEKTIFFHNDSWYLKPQKIMVTMVVLSFIGSLSTASSLTDDTSTYWVLWFAELALLIWYTAAVSGYHAILIIGATGFLFFLVSVYGLAQKYKLSHPFYGDYPASPFNYSTTIWLVGTFNLVQYAVLLPIFHLEKFKTVQDGEW